MKINLLLSIILVIFIIFLSGCRNDNELKKDVADIADGMCKITGVMQELSVADPDDSVAIAKLQMDEKQCQTEMTTLTREFQEKYKSKLSDKKFKKEYSKEFRKAILNCPHLSKEDREKFEKEVE